MIWLNKNHFFRLGLASAGLASATLVSLLFSSLTPANAQESNFGTFSLNPKNLSAVASGTTGGSTSLPAITSNTDRNENQCIGFGDPKPDHILKLTRKFDRLRLQVDSSGRDTTLIIKGPDGDFRCADDFAGSKDAGIEDSDWKPGEYQVWVGTVAHSQRRDYRLVVQGF